MPNLFSLLSQSTSEYADCICKRHAAFKDFRDSTISKWSEKTRLASGKINSKVCVTIFSSQLQQFIYYLQIREHYG